MQISSNNLIIASQARSGATTQGAGGLGGVGGAGGAAFSLDLGNEDASGFDDFQPLSFREVDKADVVMNDQLTVSSGSSATSSSAAHTSPSAGYGAGRPGSLVDVTV